MRQECSQEARFGAGEAKIAPFSLKNYIFYRLFHIFCSDCAAKYYLIGQIH